jgi:GNAT superfamily N-acetyltransferase
MSHTTIAAIRQMRVEDAAAVAALTTQLGYPSTDDEIRRRYELIKDRWDARICVAQLSARIVGWIHVQATYSLECDARAEIWGLVVDEAARRTGVGRSLMEAAEEWAAQRGFRVMAVKSNSLRVESHGFYEHLGYKIIKTQSAFRKNL